MPSGLPALTIADLTMTETDAGSETALVSVTLSEPSANAVTFRYAMRSGTAVAGRDFVAKSGLMTIPAGELSANIETIINGDIIDELNESFTVVLSSARNAVIGRGVAAIEIADNDAPPQISISDGTTIEGRAASVKVTLSHPSSQAVTATLTSVADSAVSNIDFTAFRRTITIPAGRLEMVVPIATRHDVIDEPDESFFVEVSGVQNGSIFDGIAVVTIQDNDPPSLTIGDVAVTEGADPATFQAVVSMTSSSPVPVTFRVATVNSTAVVGKDFVGFSRMVTIPAGATTATVEFSLVDDGIFESGEVFRLVLSSARNATIGKSTALVSVADNEQVPELAVEETVIEEKSGGLQAAFVRVNLSHPSALPVTFDYQTESGSALVNRDFLQARGTLTIPAGSLSAIIPVRIQGDRIDEFDETFRILLSSARNGIVAAQQGLVTIRDDDAAPFILIGNTEIAEGVSGGINPTVEVRLSEVSERPVTFSYQTSDRTAIDGTDYVATAGMITIPAGQLTGTIEVSSIDDLVAEPDRAFRIALFDAVFAEFERAEAFVTIIDDDGVELPLFEASDLNYLGAFQVPRGQQGSTSFEFGGNGLAFNSVNNSLFIGAHVERGLHLAEISVPEDLSATGALESMSVASVVQPFVDVGGLLTTNGAGLSTAPLLGYENLNLGGLLVADGGLTGGMFMGYNGAEPENSTNSHFRTSSLDLATLSTATLQGLIDVRNDAEGITGRVRGGYMTDVPPEWQDYIGATHVTGAAGQNRIQFSSAGPALFGFNAVDPEASSGDPLVYYPLENALQWSNAFVAQPLFNGTTSINGVAFVPGTRSVIFIGSNGLNQIGYGVGSRFNDKARPYSGFHSKNGVYEYQIWSYDIDDFMAVRNGTKESWSLQPNLVMNFKLPTPEPSTTTGGTAFDPATGRLYVSQKLAGPDSTPIIHVFQLGRT